MVLYWSWPSDEYGIYKFKTSILISHLLTLTISALSSKLPVRNIKRQLSTPTVIKIITEVVTDSPSPALNRLFSMSCTSRVTPGIPGIKTNQKKRSNRFLHVSWIFAMIQLTVDCAVESKTALHNYKKCTFLSFSSCCNSICMAPILSLSFTDSSCRLVRHSRSILRLVSNAVLRKYQNRNYWSK